MFNAYDPRSGIQAEAAMRTGELVPDSIILNVISSELKARGWLSEHPINSSSSQRTLSPTASFILDGFPRTVAQARKLDTFVPINFVVQLVTPPSVILSRVANRWIHAPSGRIYNIDFNAPRVPGRDNVTGEPLTQRADDSRDTWEARFHKFEEISRDLIKHYENLGCLCRVEGNSSDEITPKLFEAVEKRFC